jgi:hypothetical protein
VSVLGYNSAKFDMQMLLKELECDEWHIQKRSLMITETNLKHVHVKIAKGKNKVRTKTKMKKTKMKKAKMKTMKKTKMKKIKDV